MKVIIAGSRTITDLDTVIIAVLNSWFLPHITEVVSGAANGVDKLGESFARLHSIPIRQFPADWDGIGRGAGFVRNRLMAEYADALIAVWDGKSKGTEHMIQVAKAVGIKVYVEVVI